MTPNLKLVPPSSPDVPRGILGADAQVVPWVERQLGLPAGHFKGAMSIGIAIGDTPVAAVLYTNYQKHMETGLVTVEAVIASTTPKWCTRPILFSIFNYPFTHLKAQRIQLVLRRNNKVARKFCEELGFTYEGKGRRAWDGKQDAVMYSMLPDECRWIKGRRKNG